jgi:TonB family protein
MMGAETAKVVIMFIAVHLWQSTLVLAPLLLVGHLAKAAPARWLNRFWWLALARLFLPVQLFKPLTTLLWDQLPGTADHRFLTVTSGFMNPAIVANPAPAYESSVPSILFQGGIILWALCALAMTGFWIYLDRRRSRSHSLPWSEVPDFLADKLKCAVNHGNIPPDRIIICRGSKIPFVSGLLRPVIALPMKLVNRLPVAELTSILLHENAHRLRRDPLRMLMVRFAIILFFYYPPLWILVRKLRTSCELSCDDTVMQSGIEPALFAKALARTLQLGLQTSGHVAALDYGNRSLLTNRFKRLSQPWRNHLMKRDRLLLSLGVLLFTAALIFPLAPAAVDAPVEPPPPAEPISAPEVLKMEKAEYPADGLRDQVEGKVWVRVKIDGEGVISSAVLDRGISDYPSFGESALAAAKRFKFKPSEDRNGRGVSCAMMIPFEFKLSDSGDHVIH